MMIVYVLLRASENKVATKNENYGKKGGQLLLENEMMRTWTTFGESHWKF